MAAELRKAERLVYYALMPLYDFVCRACANEFEALVRPGEAARCPKCGGVDLEKLLSGFAVSSEERTRAAAKESRKAQIRGRKDAIIADEEYRRHHDD
jgi:putative FmdB family regulatory protein